MPFGVEDFLDLTRLLQERPEWRAELRRWVLTDELLSLPQAVQGLAEAQRRTEERVEELAEAQRRTEERVEELAEAQRRTEERVEELAEAQRRTEERVEELAEAQRRTEEQLATLTQQVADLTQQVADLTQQVADLTQDVQLLTKRVDSLSQDVGYLKGSDLERRYRERAPAYFRGLMRKIYVLSTNELSRLLEQAMDEGKLSDDEVDELLRADVIVRGKRREDGADAYLVAEVSWGVGPHDVERAARRAELLAKLGLPVISAVAGKVITYEAADMARWMGTWQVLDGRTISPTEALFEHPDAGRR